MRVYLIAAPEDEVEAEKLADYLKRFGVFIRAEYGKFAYPPAQHGEFTLALWSRNAMMSTRQMLLTNRAIDAWAEGQLVMARLEHGLNPRGLSDLEMVDLTFEAAREHRYRDVLNALRAVEDERRRALQAETPVQDLPGGGSDGGPSEDLEEDDWKGGRAYSVEAGTRSEIKTSSASEEITAEVPPPEVSVIRETKSSGGTGLFGVMLMVLGGAGLSVAVWQNYLTWQVGAMIAGGLLVAVMFLNIVLAAMSGARARPAEAKRRAVSMPEREAEAPSPAPMIPDAQAAAPAAPAAPPEEDHEVFVSYSHQNAETVLPIVETVEAKGLSIWIDKDEMRAGQGWAGQIVRAIKSAERFCLMCSEQAFASDHVRREVYLADKYGKAMVPIKLDGAEMPEDIEYFLAGRQWVDLTSLSEEERVVVIHGALSVAPS